MKQRTISAIILVAILIGSLIASSKLFAVVMAIISVIGFNEFFNIKYDNLKKYSSIKLIAIILLLLIVLNNLFFKFNLTVLVLLPLVMLTLPVVFCNDNKLYSIIDAMYVIGIIYILGFAFNNIAYLREVSIEKCIFIFIISFITDTYAYIGGSLIGRHKLTSISPKKTVEGSLIGTVMGVLIGTVYYYNIVGDMSLAKTVILCFILTILSELGDLMFSAIKRNFDKKDYSNLIPGHGGILDRFDSVIYVSLGLLLIMGVI